jgi:flagellar basal-body rod protein FlgG
MLRALWTSKSGLNANQEKLDMISNNIANVNTTGYKKIDVEFKDLLNESLDKLGTPLNDKNSIIGTGVRAGQWYRVNSQGSLMQTTKTTDIAIDGQGYFRVIKADGSSLYTRDGDFSIDSSGRIVDNLGNKLHIEYKNGFSEGNTIFTRDNFLVNNSGEIFIKEKSNTVKVGEIPAYTAVGEDAFISVGNNLYQPKADVQVFRTRDNELNQGFLEGSNVDIAQEFSDMILTQRAFQLSSKGISTADEMWGMINNLRSN